MQKRRIEAVLFDVGETLLKFGRLDRKRLFAEAVERSYRFLTQHQQPVGSFGAYRFFYSWGLKLRVFKSWLTGNDFDSLQLLRNYGRTKGFTLSDEQWEQLNWQWYRGLAEIARIDDGAPEALAQLREKGLRLGLLSNTFIHKCSLERHLRQKGLLEYLPVRLYTYDYPWRKPDKRIFEAAAEKIGVPCSNIIYVGDRIDNDVVGARRVGMLPVLVKAYTNENKAIPSDVHYIQSIAELPEWIQKNVLIETAENPTDTQSLCSKG